MALDIQDIREGRATADELPLRSLQPASAALYQTKVVIHSGKLASDTWSVPIADSVEDEEEHEWHSIVSKPRVREALRRMANEARRQIAAGEIEEGGFAIE